LGRRVYTGLRPWARRRIDRLKWRAAVFCCSCQSVPSHRIHQQRQGEVPGLVRGDPRRQLAAWHIPEKSIPRKVNETTQVLRKQPRLSTECLLNLFEYEMKTSHEGNHGEIITRRKTSYYRRPALNRYKRS